MPDRYADFASLARACTEGVDYAIRVLDRESSLIIVAPHGGGIEPGTSELAEAIAGGALSFYAFEGVRSSGNSELHVTSIRFDEPRLLEIVKHASTVLAVHGAANADEHVFIGGRDEALGDRIAAALLAAGFHAAPHPEARLAGTESANLCNRGSSGAGVQLEISLGLRRTLFASVSRSGRRQRTARFGALVAALCGVLGESAPAVAPRNRLAPERI